MSLMIDEILKNEKLKNELESSENTEQIYDFFSKNGYVGSYDEFCTEMEEILNSFEISDDDLDLVAGGMGKNTGKMAAAFLSVLSLVGGAPGINAANASAGAAIQVSSSEKNQTSFENSSLDSFFYGNKGFWAWLKSKFFEKNSKRTFARIDNLILKLKNYYESNENDLNAEVISKMLFNIIQIAEEKNPGSNIVQERVAEAKKTLAEIASKLKSKSEIKSEETLEMIKKVEQLYAVVSAQSSGKTTKFHSVQEIKDAVENMIILESLKTYKSSAGEEEIKQIEEIISAISKHYVGVGNLSNKNFENYVKETKDYKELLKSKKSINIKNILKIIKSVCRNDVEFQNGQIKAVESGKEETFVSMNKIYRKIKIDEKFKKTMVRQLKAACEYSNHVYMFEKSDRYEYDAEADRYVKLEETNEDEENKSNHSSAINEDSPYFGYFGDNFAGLIDIIPQGQEEGTVYLAFRGTYSKDDAWIDGDFSKSECSFLNNELVHRGFLNRYLALQRDMKNLLNEKINIYKRKTGKDIKKIVVTGHSLGGALSTLAALDLQQIEKKIPVKLITFCSPRVLSFEAYDYVVKKNILRQSGENGAIRIYRHGDVVPSMPLGSMGYKHFGEVFCITNAPSGFESDSEKTVYSKIKSYFSLEDWKEWAKSFIGYHSIEGVLKDVSNLGEDEEVTMYKELF